MFGVNEAGAVAIGNPPTETRGVQPQVVELLLWLSRARLYRSRTETHWRVSIGLLEPGLKAKLVAVKSYGLIDVADDEGR